MILLAIVIPYYNIRFFEQTLKSLANQTDKRFNVYIGNDNSFHDPELLIKQYETQINILYKKFNENLGGKNLVEQWNRCIHLTNEEQWIMLLGDDDYLSNNVVEMFYKSITEVEELKINVINFATYNINDENKIISPKYESPKIRKAKKYLFRKLFDGGTGRGSLSEQIFRKKTFEEIGFRKYTLGWHSDDMAWLEFTGFSDIYHINNAVVYIRIGAYNISGKTDSDKEKILAAQEFYEDLITTYSDKLDKKEILKIIFSIEYCEKKTGKKNPKINKLKWYIHSEGFIGLIRYVKRTLIV